MRLASLYVWDSNMERPKDYEVLKAKFLKIYANIPSPLRGEIVAVIGEETFSWSACKAEIEHDTDKAPILLAQLKKIGVL